MITSSFYSRMKHVALITAAVVSLCFVFKPVKPHSPATPEYDRRIDSLINLMALEEEIAFLHSIGLFSSAGLERLNIPGLEYTDGPLGIREELGKTSCASLRLTTDSATFFPNGSALAATWNPELVYGYGVAMGEEARAIKKDILLAPAINITRTPLGGRRGKSLPAFGRKRNKCTCCLEEIVHWVDGIE